MSTNTNARSFELRSAFPSRRWTFSYLFLLVFLSALLVSGVSCQGLEKIKRNGGYDESWKENVDGTLLHDVAYGERPWEIMDVYLPETFEPSKSKGRSSLFTEARGSAARARSSRALRGEWRRRGG